MGREKSRLVALRIAMLSLRSLENWRRPVTDYDNIAILLAIAAISGEKLTRTTLEPEFQNLAMPNPGRSAHAVQHQFDCEGDGTQSRNDQAQEFSPEFTQPSEPMALVRAQLDILNRAANEFVRDGVLKWRNSKAEAD